MTGSLGSFLLEQLSQLPPEVVERIICLVRAKDDGDALNRIEESQSRRGLGIDRQSLEVYAADLTSSELGLTPQVYSRLVDEADVILHVRMTACHCYFSSHNLTISSRRRGLYISRVA